MEGGRTVQPPGKPEPYSYLGLHISFDTIFDQSSYHRKELKPAIRGEMADVTMEKKQQVIVSDLLLGNDTQRSTLNACPDPPVAINSDPSNPGTQSMRKFSSGVSMYQHSLVVSRGYFASSGYVAFNCSWRY
ncbi:hypothetical protein FRC18_000245 [Serendipita sp. 400]|nr:hypothetical protein FRC18_000245 [Serendipita sp. 400]